MQRLSCFCRILALLRPSRVSSSLVALQHPFLSRERRYTQQTFSRKRMDPPLDVVKVFHPKQPASKVECAFLCLGSLKHSTARSTPYRGSTARPGGSAY